MTKRPHISLRTKLAAALLTIVRPDEHGQLTRVIPHAMARRMTDDLVISLFQFDHWPIRHADGGPSVAWNLEPRPIIEHRIKTAKKDAPEMKKNRRIAKRRAAESLTAVDVRGARDDEYSRKPPKRAWPSRPFPGSKKDKALRAQRNAR